MKGALLAPLLALLHGGVASFVADARLPATWEAAKPYTASRGQQARVEKDQEELGLDDEVVGDASPFGERSQFVDEVVGDAAPLGKRSRFLVEEARALEESSGSGSGSGEEASGELSPASPPVSSPPPPPSPPAPPSPPFVPGVVSVTKNYTKIVFEVTVAGDVSSFDEAAYEANLRTAISCGPDAIIELEVSAASVNVKATVLVAEDDTSVDSDAVAANAENLAAKPQSEISTDLGVSVEQVAPVVVTKSVETVVQVAPPPPLMPPPLMPPPPPPAAPPPTAPEDDSDSSGMETWLLAIIIIGAALVLVMVVLLCYRKVSQSSMLKDTAVGKGGNFPLAIGASTTQHV